MGIRPLWYIIVIVQRTYIFCPSVPFPFPIYILSFHFLARSRIFPNNSNAVVG